MINFTLDNLEDYEREFGDKFYLLPRKKRQNLKRGDLVISANDKAIKIHNIV